MIMIVCALLMSYAHTARAQWVVTDPTNLVQNIISATQGTTTATNMIKNLQEGIKIYNQGRGSRSTTRACDTKSYINDCLTEDSPSCMEAGV